MYTDAVRPSADRMSRCRDHNDCSRLSSNIAVQLQRYEDVQLHLYGQ